jgi:arylsulfatase A-like enzyme
MLLLTVMSAVIAQERPNILFIIADDWGRHDAGVYGNTWIKTPAFDRLAREGILFRNAYTPNAKCAPSRACIMTGRNPWQLKEAANHICYFPKESITFSEALTTLGFHVGTTGKGWSPGVAKDASGKDRAMAGKMYSKHKTTPPTKAMSTNDYTANFVDFVDAAKSGEPWIFWCGITEPHREYEYGSGVAKAGKKLTDIPRVPGYWPDNEQVRNDMLDYALEVEYVDLHIGRMLAELEKRGQLDNTLIIVTSDNGMPFPRVKGNTYEASNHLPFAVRWPKGISKAGVTVDDFISFIDIAPTILDVLGVSHADSGMAAITGQSLRPIFAAARDGRIVPERDHVLIGRERNDIGRPNDEGYPVRGLVSTAGLLLINYEPSRWPACNPETGYLDSDGSPTKSAILAARKTADTKSFWDYCFGKRTNIEYYQLENDVDCLANVASTNVATVTALTERLQSRLKAEGDPRMDGQGAMFDQYLHSNEANRGFYQRHQQGEKVNAGWVNPTDFEKDVLE